MYVFAFSLRSSGTGTYRISRPARSAEYRSVVSVAFANTAAHSDQNTASPRFANSMKTGSISTATPTPRRRSSGRRKKRTTSGSHCVARLNLPWNALTRSGVTNVSRVSALNW